MAADPVGVVVEIPSTNGLSLRGLLCASTPLGEPRSLDGVVVYLHGFPDMSVHPLRPDFASRFPRKLWHSVRAAHPDWAFLCYNASGLPGSSGPFHSKTLRQEVDDCRAALRYVREFILQEGPGRRVHVVGLSTGAIVAALVAGDNDANVTVTAVAGLLDLQEGLRLDFDEEQIASFQSEGVCYKEFFLPLDCGPGTGPWWDDNICADDPPTHPDTGQRSFRVRWRLDLPYYDAYSTLSVADAIRWYEGPLLVIHGQADTSVPMRHGQELFAAATAAAPKRLEIIEGANHLLSSDKHFRTFARIFLAFLAR